MDFVKRQDAHSMPFDGGVRHVAQILRHDVVQFLVPHFHFECHLVLARQLVPSALGARVLEQSQRRVVEFIFLVFFSAIPVQTNVIIACKISLV